MPLFPIRPEIHADEFPKMLVKFVIPFFSEFSQLLQEVENPLQRIYQNSGKMYHSFLQHGFPGSDGRKPARAGKGGLECNLTWLFRLIMFMAEAQEDKSAQVVFASRGGPGGGGGGGNTAPF